MLVTSQHANHGLSTDSRLYVSMSTLSTGPVVGAARVLAVPDLGASQQTDTLTLPKGFPAKLDTQLAWVGSDFNDPQTYIYELTQADLAEISQAISHFKGNSSTCSTQTLEGFYLSIIHQLTLTLI
jgi:hypothetical protein